MMNAHRLSTTGPCAATFIASLLVAFGAMALASPPAGASEGCGTYSYNLGGIRLVNDGISDSAGPFAVDIPAGTYTVTLLSHDHHDTQVGVGTQPGEQYFVTLDSGYSSPTSADIPDAETTITTSFAGQVIGASKAISVHHGGAPGINSVNVVCVGFTPEIDVTEQEPTDDQPTVERPPTPPTAVESHPDPIPPTSELVILREPLPSTADPAPAQSDPTADDIPTQVEGIVATPESPAQLALTGPSTAPAALIAAGLTLITCGILLDRRQKRFV